MGNAVGAIKASTEDNSISQSFEKLAEIKRNINDKEMGSRYHFFTKLVETVLIRPFISAATLTGRVIKFLTWDIAKAGVYMASGRQKESGSFLEYEFLKTIKALRDLVFIPSIALRAFEDMMATSKDFVDDIKPVSRQDYIKVDYTMSFQQFSSYSHDCATFEVIQPTGITEFPAVSDPDLKTVMASHIFKPGMMAINFGSPNVATFITEENEDNSVQTIKVDAKSLYREPMAYHATNGKIQSGVFLVPTNLPKEALDRFKQAAEKMQGRTDFSCVNTNCKVLKEAGFSIEGVAMDGVIFPVQFMDHLLFRNVFYTDLNGVKHKIHFDILNTTQDTIEKHLEKVDTAVVGTCFRHARRCADIEESKKARGAIAKLVIAEEKERLAKAASAEQENDETLPRRKVSISVPSGIGNFFAAIWGRHTMYELDFSDKQKEISDVFQKFSTADGKTDTIELQPFSQENPSFFTKLKRDIFFSKPMIQFLHCHMMGRADEVHLSTQEIFKHLKSTKGAHLNYVLLDDKLVVARTQVNTGSNEIHENAADWVLSKHALLAGRKEAYCSGEIWYDETKKRFMMNGDSGTYAPSFERVQTVVNLANHILGNFFEAVDTHD